MPGLNQGPPPSDAPVVDTAEQVSGKISLFLFFFCVTLTSFPFILTGIHIVLGPLENAQAWPCRSTDGSDGSDAG